MLAAVCQGVIHRDLKPENVLLCHPSRNGDPGSTAAELKICDFGTALRLRPGQQLVTPCGTLAYMAPEIVAASRARGGERGYDTKADVWSVGVLMYVLLAARFPLAPEGSTADVCDRILAVSAVRVCSLAYE